MGHMDTDLTYSDATKLAELIRNREVIDAAVAADEALAAGAAVGPSTASRSL
jgi:hypothetical protein